VNPAEILHQLEHESRPALFRCSYSGCLYSIITWTAELPPMTDSWHVARAWPKCPDGHRAKLEDVER
jgi:hypothetical protein